VSHHRQPRGSSLTHVRPACQRLAAQPGMQSAKPQWALGPAGGVMDPAVASRAAEIPKPLSAAAQWIAASYWIAAEQWLQRNSRQRSQRWRLRSPCRRRWGARCSGALRSRPPLTCTGLHIVRSSPGTGAQGRSTERVENLSRQPWLVIL
jgi:hypothetical protein